MESGGAAMPLPEPQDVPTIRRHGTRSVSAAKATVQQPANSPAEELLPRTLPTWLRLLWSRVLFPGHTELVSAWRWTPILILCLVSGALLYPCLSFYLFEPDEGRYAQIP